MKLLDLFCGAGGAAMGYYRAGFTDIVGVDIEPQPRYPFEFFQGDALEYLAEHGKEFDLIHASPPCQAHTVAKSIWGRQYTDYVGSTRDLLVRVGKPYVIENVPGAPLVNPLMLCGSMFGLKLIRHRLFECKPEILFSPMSCSCRSFYTNAKSGFSSFENGATAICVAGHNFSVEDAREAMGIDWMGQKGLSQAIPPAYTEWIARRIVEVENEIHRL